MGLFTSEAGGAETNSIFSKSAEEQKPATQPASEKNLAVQASILSDEPTDAKFQELQSLPQSEARARTEDTITSAKVLDQNEMQQAMIDAMADPTIPEESRVALAEKFNELTTANRNSLELVAQDMLLRESGNNSESEGIRTSVADILSEVTADFQDQQRLANQIYATDSSTAEAVLDFAQLMIPFDESIFTASVISKINAGDVTSALEALTLLGNSKADMRDMFQSMSLEDRYRFREVLSKVMKDSRGLLFTNDNEMAQADLFNSITLGGYYESPDQWIDNAISILDMVGIGGLLKAPVKAAKLSKVKKMLSRADVQPASPARVAEATNPKEARTMRAMAIADETGETAQATHVASREDVIVDAEAPQPRNDEGTTQDVVHTTQAEIDAHLEDTLLEYSDDEILKAHQAVETKFESVGAVLRHESSPAPVRNDNGSTTFSNVYTMRDSGWSNPTEALAAVQRQFREYDVPEGSFQLMQKQGNEWAPVNTAEVEAKIALRDALVKAKKKLPEELKKKNMQQEYAVQVNFTRDFDPMDVKHEALSYTRNILDRIPFLSAMRKGGSSLTRMLFDPASIFDPRVFLSANYAVDKAAAIEESIIRASDKFVKPFSKLEKGEQDLIFQMLKEQNLRGKKFTAGELAAKGVSQHSDLFKAWEETWDLMFNLENKDLRTSLKRNGYGISTNSRTNTSLVAKPIRSRNSVPKNVNVIDASTGEVRLLSGDEVDALYESGGTVNKLRRTTEIDGTPVDYTVSRNTAEDYFREFRDTDQVLNYREGYFAVKYDDPYFIIDKKTGRAIKTASGYKAAKEMAERMTATSEDGVEYVFRENKDLSRAEYDDFSWDIAQESGRSSQRLRGERLGSDLNQLEGSVLDPAQSLLGAARSISRRASMRAWLDKMKLRFMDEFDELLPVEQGQKYFPRTPQDLNTDAVGTASSKKAADARTMLEYINSMEYGYRNTLDDGFRAILNGIAEAAGVKSARAEKALRVLAEEGGSPTAFLRGRAFDLYLATNPLRQFVVQAHQASLLAANFPKYVGSQRLLRDVVAIHFAFLAPSALGSKSVRKIIGMSESEAMSLYKEYKATGFDAGIDRHNLVEQGLDELVEAKNFKNIKAAHKAIVTPLRKVGFDAGERINIMSAWLAYRNKAIEDGADLSNAKVKAEIMAKARNYTLNMNAAGEMPYNKNSLALIFQFMQVPHKMLTTMLTNRALSPKEKTRLWAYNMLMLPLPTAMVYNMVGDEGLPDDPDLRDLALNGLQGAMLNKLAQLTMGDDTRIDYSSLSALDPYGLYELMGNLVSMDIVEIFSQSPSMSLFAGHNPKVGALIDDLSRMITAPSGEQFKTSVMSFLNMSSGMSNFSTGAKELYFKDVHDRYSRSGFVTDEDITTLESIAKMFGFGTVQEALNRISKTELYRASQERQEDIREIARMQHNALARQGVTIDSMEYASRMLDVQSIGTFFTTPMNEAEKKIYLSEIFKNIRKGDNNLFSLALKFHGLVPIEAENALKAAGYSEEMASLRMLREIGEYEE